MLIMLKFLPPFKFGYFFLTFQLILCILTFDAEVQENKKMMSMYLEPFCCMHK